MKYSILFSIFRCMCVSLKVQFKACKIQLIYNNSYYLGIRISSSTVTPASPFSFLSGTVRFKGFYRVWSVVSNSGHHFVKKPIRLMDLLDVCTNSCISMFSSDAVFSFNLTKHNPENTYSTCQTHGPWAKSGPPLIVSDLQDVQRQS